MTYPFRNLVFEGGGVKGIAYVGALEVLEKEDIIEQTFGIGDDQRNNQVFQDLPTPKSRMKREIDIEKEITAGGGSGN